MSHKLSDDQLETVNKFSLETLLHLKRSNNYNYEVAKLIKIITQYVVYFKIDPKNSTQA